jgi:hypothetical protein
MCDHLMTGALESGTSKFRGASSVRKGNSTGRPRRSVEDMDRVGGGFHIESEEADLTSKCIIADSVNDCPQCSSEEPTSEILQITDRQTASVTVWGTNVSTNFSTREFLK